MIRGFITVFIQNVPFIMLTTSILIGAIVGLAARSKKIMVQSMVRYLMLLAVGATGIWAFVSHAIFAGYVADFVGWQTCPFQFEVAVVNLGLGLAGLVGFRQKFDYWLAVSIILTCFLWGSALGHIYQMIFHGNFATGNAGMILYMDILIPLILNILLAHLYYYDCGE